MLAISGLDQITRSLRDCVIRLIGVLMVVLAAATLAACAGSPTQESTGDYIDDTTITTKVKTKLIADKEVSALAVNVETFKGVVQLSGFVSTESERQKAERIARSVGGVKGVKNDIVVK